MRPGHVSPILSLITLAGCGGSNPAPVQAPPPTQPTRFVFARDNSTGGRDLLTADANAVAPPVNLTRHIEDRVVDDSVVTTPGGYVVYAATRGQNTNYYSVPRNQDGKTPPHALTAFTAAAIDVAGVIGDHLVVLARVGDVEDLFAAPVDGSAALRNLTNNGGQRGDLTWRKEFRTQAGRLLYQMETGTGPTLTRSVHAIDLSTPSAPRKMNVAQDLVSLELDDASNPPRPQEKGGFVVLEAINRAGTSVQYLLGDTGDGTARALTPVYAPTTTFRVEESSIVGDTWGFVGATLLNGAAVNQNLFAVRLDAIPTQPAPTQLTHYAATAHNELDVRARVAGTDVVVALVSQPDPTRPGNFIVDLISVDLRDAGSFTELTDRNLHASRAVGEADITRVVLLGRVALYERASDPGKVWRVTVGAARSEKYVLPAEPKAQTILPLEAVADESARGLDRTVVAAFVSVVTDIGTARFSNFVSAQPSEGDLALVTMTAQTQIADDAGTRLLSRKETRVVYTRSGQMYSADWTTPGSELRISANSSGLADSYIASHEGGNRVFFVANGQLFSAPIDKSADQGETRQLTNLIAPGQTLTEIHFASADRVVYSVREGNRVKVMSSPIAVIAPQMDDASRSIDTADAVVLRY